MLNHCIMYFVPNFHHSLKPQIVVNNENLANYSILQGLTLTIVLTMNRTVNVCERIMRLCIIINVTFFQMHNAN